jgi:hypothetical protein
MLAPLLHYCNRDYSGFQSARATGPVSKKDISVFYSVMLVVFRITSLSVQTDRHSVLARASRVLTEHCILLLPLRYTTITIGVDRVAQFYFSNLSITKRPIFLLL